MPVGGYLLYQSLKKQKQIHMVQKPTCLYAFITRVVLSVRKYNMRKPKTSSSSTTSVESVVVSVDDKVDTFNGSDVNVFIDDTDDDEFEIVNHI